MDQIFGKVQSGAIYLFFLGALPGDHAPGRVHSPPKAGRKRKEQVFFVILTRQQNVFNDSCPGALRVHKFVVQTMFAGIWILKRFHELGQKH